MKVVVIGRNYTSRLGMIRAAGMAGHYVIVIKTNGRPGSKDIDAYSKYTKEYLFAKEPNREALISAVMSVRDSSQKVILMPVDDYAASTIDDNIDMLKNDFLFPNIIMEQGAINRLMDKNVQKRKAINAGLNVAKGWCISIENGRYSLPSDLKYPVFPKPQISFKGNKRCMKRCGSEQELKSVLDEVASQRDCPMLLEQYIKIDKEYALLGLSDGSNVVIPGVIQLLESGKGGHRGVTLNGEIIPPHYVPKGFMDQLKVFVKSLHFCGLFDIDFYERDGVFYFNELNLRFGASGYAVTHSGINLPDAFIKVLTKDGQIDESLVIVKDLRFVNEKVAQDDLDGGYISKSDYHKFIEEADFCFINSDDDPLPFRKLNSRKLLLIKTLKRIKRNIIH